MAESTPTNEKAIHVDMPGMYWGESLLGNITAEIMPPS